MDNTKWSPKNIDTNNYQKSNRSVKEMERERKEQEKRFENWEPKTIADETNSDKAYELKQGLRDEERKEGKDARMQRLQGDADVTAKRREASRRAIKSSL